MSASLAERNSPYIITPQGYSILTIGIRSVLFILLFPIRTEAQEAGRSDSTAGAYILCLAVEEYSTHLKAHQECPYAARTGIKKAAESFYNEAQSTFKADQIKSKKLLLNSEATVEALRRFLYVELRGIADNSTVIVYFSGHGQILPFRPNKETNKRPMDLLLLMGNANWPISDKLESLDGFLEQTIRAKEIFDTLSHLGKCNVMVVLDCCFSQAGGVDRLEWNKAYADNKTRAFALASSGYAEKSYATYFTDALVSVWKGARDSNTYLTPSALELAVNQTMQGKREGFGAAPNCHLLFGEWMKVSIVQLGKPQTLLICDFPDGCDVDVEFIAQIRKQEISLGVYDADTRSRWSVFPCLAPKEEFTLKIKYKDKFILPHDILKTRIEWNGKAFPSAPLLTNTHIDSFPLSLSVFVPKDLVVYGVKPDYRARVAESTGDLVRSVGGNPTSHYRRALEELAALEGKQNTQPILQKLVAHGNDDSREVRTAKLALDIDDISQIEVTEKLASDLFICGEVNKAGYAFAAAMNWTQTLATKQRLARNSALCFKASGGLESSWFVPKSEGYQLLLDDRDELERSVLNNEYKKLFNSKPVEAQRLLRQELLKARTP